MPLAHPMENPLFVKSVMTRLKMSSALPWIAIVVVIGLLMLFGVYFIGTQGGRNVPEDLGKTAFGFLTVLQGGVLLLVGTARVASTVSEDKDSGVIDFLRITPQRDRSLVLGYLFGAPVREYVMAALLLPMVAYTVISAGFRLVDVWLFYAQFLVLAVTYHMLGIVTGLLTRRPRGSAAAAVAVVVFMNLFIGGPMSAAGHTTPFSMLPAYELLYGSMRVRHRLPTTLFGAPLPDLLWAMILQVVFIAFTWVLSCRKIRSSARASYSKPQALAVCAITVLLLVGTLWKSVVAPEKKGEFIFFIWSYTIVAGACALALASVVTPPGLQFAKGVRRMLKGGRTRLPPLSEEASNGLTVGALAALWVAGFAGLVAGSWIGGDGEVWRSTIYLPVLMIPVLVGQFAAAQQFLSFRFGRGAMGYLVLYVALLWIVPLILGGIVTAAEAGKWASGLVMAISPLAGVGFCLIAAFDRQPNGEEVMLWSAGISLTINALLMGIWLALDSRQRVGIRTRETDLYKEKTARGPLAVDTTILPRDLLPPAAAPALPPTA